jgi:DNA-binding transcriptional regulator PaaX
MSETKYYWLGKNSLSLGANRPSISENGEIPADVFDNEEMSDQERARMKKKRDKWLAEGLIGTNPREAAKNVVEALKDKTEEAKVSAKKLEKIIKQRDELKAALENEKTEHKELNKKYLALLKEYEKLVKQNEKVRENENG